MDLYVVALTRREVVAKSQRLVLDAVPDRLPAVDDAQPPGPVEVLCRLSLGEGPPDAVRRAFERGVDVGFSSGGIEVRPVIPVVSAAASLVVVAPELVIVAEDELCLLLFLEDCCEARDVLLDAGLVGCGLDVGGRRVFLEAEPVRLQVKLVFMASDVVDGNVCHDFVLGLLVGSLVGRTESAIVEWLFELRGGGAVDELESRIRVWKAIVKGEGCHFLLTLGGF